MRRLRATLAGAGTVVFATASIATAGTASHTRHVDPALASLPPALSDGVRPGPPVLYAPEVHAPQFDNNSRAFRAKPLLVEGTEAYVAGEYLYQGYLYADHGAGTNGSGPGAYVGGLTYPTNFAVYADNAANLVEFRASTLQRGAVVYRFTLNTLLPDPQHRDRAGTSSTAIVTVAFDTDHNTETGCSTLPHDPGAPFPGTDQVLTTWGTGADFAVCTKGKWVSAGHPVTTSENLRSRQIMVTVPRSDSNPTGKWFATVAVGLNDGHAHWLQPQATADATHPGGAPSSGHVSGIFDLGLRFNEPVSSSKALPLFSGVGGSPDTMQGAALENNDPTAFQHPIDFSQLAARRSSSTVPRTGVQVRVLASRVNHGEGIDDGLHPIGNLEPYTLDIPSSYRPGHRLPFMLALHSLGDHYWQFTQSQGQHDWADTHRFFVATPEGRGPDTSYTDEAEYDVFEVWNDVARHFDLDPSRTVASGYSMGGVGTQWLASLYPDLFGKAYEVVGGPYTTAWLGPIREDSSWRGDMMLWIENMRHVPVLDVYGGEDEFGGAAVQAGQNLSPGMPVAPAGLDRLGYRYIGVTYPAAEHLTFAGAGYMIPVSDPFLDNPVVERDPAHVSFSYLPVTDDRALGLVHNHAYWVSGVRLAHGGAAPITGEQVSQADGGFTDDSGTAAKASIDAVSAAFGVRDPAASRGATAGVGPLVLPYAECYQTWDAPPAAPRANSLRLTLTNVAESTYDVTAAHLNTRVPLTLAVQTSTATIVHLDHAFPTSVKVLVDGKPSPFRLSAGQLTITLPTGAHNVVVDGGHR